ncbi:MAG: hypothetical protein ACRDON_01715 [Gaiellaceae bacterium]
MALAERFQEAVRGLPRGWERARVDVTVEDPEQADRAALILAPATPGRNGGTFRLQVHSASEGLAPTPELVRRMLARLDASGIRGRLRLVGHEQPTEAARAPAPGGDRRALAAQWDALLSRLPPDWSDLYAEVELHSTDYLERGALLLAPVNPARYGGRAAFSFRAARDKGYGVAPVMARRCFERLDQERITGGLRALRVLSGTHLASTQGPVWLVGGRSV